MAYSVKSNCRFDSEKYRKNTVTHVVTTLTLLRRYTRYIIVNRVGNRGYGGDVTIYSELRLLLVYIIKLIFLSLKLTKRVLY